MTIHRVPRIHISRSPTVIRRFCQMAGQYVVAAFFALCLVLLVWAPVSATQCMSCCRSLGGVICPRLLQSEGTADLGWPWHHIT